MPLRGTIGQILKTYKRKNNKELFIEWRIEKFFSLSDELGDWYESPLFSFNDGCWLLSLFPNGQNHPPTSGCVILYIEKKDKGPRKNVHVKFAVRGSDGVEMKVETQWEFSKADPCFWCKLCLRSELKKFKSRLMPDDILNITCDLKAALPRTTRRPSFFQNASVQTDFIWGVPYYQSTDGRQLLDKTDSSNQKDVAVVPDVQSPKQGEMKSSEKILECKEASVVIEKMPDKTESPSENKIPEIKEAIVVIQKLPSELRSPSEEKIPESEEATVVTKNIQSKKSSTKRKIPDNTEDSVVTKKMQSKKKL